MIGGFQIRGDSSNPFHLSVGSVAQDENLFALIKKSDGAYTLPRETIYSGESLEEAIQRGAEEELGIKVKVTRYLGSLITYFNRPDGTVVEKTTIYFLTEKIGESIKQQADDELSDTVEWLEKVNCIRLLKEHHNSEFEIVERVN